MTPHEAYKQRQLEEGNSRTQVVIALTHQEKRATLASASKVLASASERYRALPRASDGSLDYHSLAYPPLFLALFSNDNVDNSKNP